ACVGVEKLGEGRRGAGAEGEDRGDERLVAIAVDGRHGGRGGWCVCVGGTGGKSSAAAAAQADDEQQDGGAADQGEGGGLGDRDDLHGVEESVERVGALGGDVQRLAHGGDGHGELHVVAARGVAAVVNPRGGL